jgi:RND family efflux transporter MFP subunit
VIRSTSKTSQANCLAALSVALLAACGPANAPAPAEVRPVRVMTVETRPAGETISLTGTVQAQTEVNLAFRIDGQLIERLVNVGDQVGAGQLVARIDPVNERNALRAARASVAAAAGQLDEARSSYDRQRELLAGGWTTRARYEQALQVHQSAAAQLDAAEAALRIAEERLSFTEIFSDAPGKITARGAEPGEVVRAGQMIVQIARQDGRDAVFDVPSQVKDKAPVNPIIDVSLSMDPAVRATGRVREISPRADPVTGTFRVRVGLSDVPPQMRLGTAVTGRMRVDRGAELIIPASALTAIDRKPAVWIVDTVDMTVTLRAIEIAHFSQASISVAQGLAPGDIVVTAGVQALRPGQKVRLLGVAS